jgi:nucleotide-binding universal stress UspA family protein
MKILLAVNDCEASVDASAYAHTHFPEATFHVFSVAPIAEILKLTTGPRARSDAPPAYELIALAEVNALHVAEAALAGFEHSDAATTTTTGDVAQAICDEAALTHADLIIVGSTPHRGLSRVFDTSVSHHVLQHAPCPVLVVKTGARQYA